MRVGKRVKEKMSKEGRQADTQEARKRNSKGEN